MTMKPDTLYLGSALRRRSFLAGSAALAAGALLPLPALAQASARIDTLRGEVRVNGRRLAADGAIRPGDRVVTLADGYVVFAIGGDAFMLRERSELRLDPSPEPLLVTGLRLLTGALGAVFGRRKSGDVRIVTPTVTAGIRGTGCYTEARGDGTYFCTCYGTIAMAANANPRERVVATTRHHDSPQLFLHQPRDGSLIAPAGMETHTDAELDMLEKCVGRRAPW
jgi:hypothetical protein